MKTAYICSPYSGDTERNKQYARELTARAIQDGYYLKLLKNSDVGNEFEKYMEQLFKKFVGDI